MQEEGKSKGTHSTLEQHWEKLVLVAVIVLGLAYVGTQFSGGGNPAVRKLDDTKKQIDQQKTVANPKIESPKFEGALVIGSPVGAEVPTRWSNGTPTLFKHDYKEKKEDKPRFLVPDVTVEPPAFQSGGVELTWKLSEVTVDPKARPAPKVVPPATFFYRIERRKKGAADWELLKPELKTESLRYVDTTTTPKVDYEFRIWLGSTDPGWVGANPKLLAPNPGNAVAIRTPGIWEFEFSNFNPTDLDEDKPKPGTVYVKIKKHDAKAGTVEWSKIHTEGTPLGFSKDGDKETSLHLVYSPMLKRTVEVDFNCGGKILRMERDKLIRYKRQVCSPVGGPAGPVCAGPVATDGSYKVHEVIYTDEEGKTQSATRISEGAKLADQLCPDHGGEAPPAALTPEEKAAKMLEEADALWDSAKPGDKKAAQTVYKLLVDQYGDTAAVKPRKAEIAARAKETVK